MRSFFKKTKGHPGELKNQEIFCPLLNKWIGAITPCMEICDERGDYLNSDTDDIILSSAKQFNEAAKKAGFTLPQDLKHAINVCLYCQAVCQDDNNKITEIPALEKIDRDLLLKKLYT